MPAMCFFKFPPPALKKARMIKSPLDLRVNADPAIIIADAVTKQRELEEAAKAEERETGEYIRPIVLFQAGTTGSAMDVDHLRNALLEMKGITTEQVAVSTGERNQLEGVDVMARGEEIRYIITVRKLVEGWDCPFAYVLCSVGNITATRAVEQILGRVLRLPGARLKGRNELNVAYAFAVHPDFQEAAECVQTALREGAGFNTLEARDFVSDNDGTHRQNALFAPASSAEIAEKSAAIDCAAPEHLERWAVSFVDAKRFPGYGMGVGEVARGLAALSHGH